MIDLVFRIRKAAPPHLKPVIKLADPDLLDRLAQEYPKLTDRELRHNTLQLMALAGPAWLALIDRSFDIEAVRNDTGADMDDINTSKSTSGSMVYRGQKLYS